MEKENNVISNGAIIFALLFFIIVSVVLIKAEINIYEREVEAEIIKYETYTDDLIGSIILDIEKDVTLANETLENK